MKNYLNQLQTQNQIPNFWCSEEYAKYAGWEEKESKYRIYVLEGNDLMLPSLPTVVNTPGVPLFLTYEDWWCGLPDQKGEKLLDYNFIFDPENFLDLSGGKWKMFRKKVKRFPETKKDLKYWWVEDGVHDVTDTLLAWLKNRNEEEEIADGDIMIKYVENSPNKKILFDDNEIYGVNIWDENFRFINYRYTFFQPIPYLGDYLRLLFYTDPDIISKNKLVNDGGCLDKESLFFYKTKLNPLAVKNIYTNQGEKNEI